MNVSDPDMAKYCSLMEEIKRRMNVVQHFVAGTHKTLYLETTVETIWLQIRKVLELVALGSLVANESLYRQTSEKISQQWNSKRIMGDIDKINPDFYPKPIIQGPGNDIVASVWEDRVDDYLDREEFAEFYDKCGRIMHASNPFGEAVDYEDYDSKTDYFTARIVNLLSAHTIRLVDGKKLYLVQMGGSEAEHVRCDEFLRMDKM